MAYIIIILGPISCLLSFEREGITFLHEIISDIVFNLKKPCYSTYDTELLKCLVHVLIFLVITFVASIFDETHKKVMFSSETRLQ